MKNESFLLEIGTEEIPAGYLDNATGQLAALFSDTLEEKNVDFENISVYYTPRRLTISIKSMAPKQNDITDKVKGPPVRIAFDDSGTPSQALLSFSKKTGVPIDTLNQEETPKGAYIFAEKEIIGQETTTVLEECIPSIISSLRFPKSMRWGTHSASFARPIHWIVCLLGNTVVPFSFDGIASDRVTYGHRAQTQKSVSLPQADLDLYIQTLKKQAVLVDNVARKGKIRTFITDYHSKNNLLETIDEDLLDTVTNLVECPGLEEGTFSADYLHVPSPVLVTAMKSHQKYFPLFDKNKNLINRFLVIFNGSDALRNNVIRGNERVLNARLADAQFFWNEDKKVKLEQRLERLKTVVFQQKLGTYYDKTKRVESMTDFLSSQLGVSQDKSKDALRAAVLAKTDLVTDMVKEFPTLQGIMGKEYALVDGESEGCAQAILEHYMPRFSGDVLPQSLPGAIVAIADKIDTICGCFFAGLIPTGSQDPYMLRRHTLGIFRIIEQHNLNLDISALITKSLQDIHVTDIALHEKISSFIKERMSNYLLNLGYDYDLIDAVLQTNFTDFLSVIKKLNELKSIRTEASFLETITIVQRTFNIMKNATLAQKEPLEDILEESDEKELFKLLFTHTETITKMCLDNEYIEASNLYTDTFSKPIHDFFDNVLVNVEDERIKNNRLALLYQINRLYTNYIADLSKIVITEDE